MTAPVPIIDAAGILIISTISSKVSFPEGPLVTSVITEVMVIGSAAAGVTPAEAVGSESPPGEAAWSVLDEAPTREVDVSVRNLAVSSATAGAGQAKGEQD